MTGQHNATKVTILLKGTNFPVFFNHLSNTYYN